MVATVQNNKPTTVASVNLMRMRPLKCSLSFIIIEIRTQSVNSISGKKDLPRTKLDCFSAGRQFRNLYLNG